MLDVQTWSISMSWALAPGHSMATFTMSDGGGMTALLSGIPLKHINTHKQLLHYCKSIRTAFRIYFPANSEDEEVVRERRGSGEGLTDTAGRERAI